MSAFLEYKPSHLAAACLLAAININSSHVATKIGLKQLNVLQVDNLTVESSIQMESNEKNANDHHFNNPLRIWNE